MDIALYLLYGIEFVVAALLVLVILVQRSKAGGGLGGLATTSSGVEEAFGSDAGNVLVKVTAYLAIVFAVTTISIGMMQGIVGNKKNTGVAPVAENAAPAAPEKAVDATITPALNGDAPVATEAVKPAVEPKAAPTPAGATEKKAADAPAK